MNRSNEHRHLFLLSTVFVLLFILCLKSFAYPVKITPTKDAINIGLSVEYFEDKDSTLTLKDIIRLDNENKFSTTTKVPLNFGYSKSTYWLSFSVLGETTTKSGWILDIPYAPLDNLTLYLPDGKGGFTEYRSGDRVPFSEKEIVYKNAAFVLGEKLLPYQQYYLRVNSNGSLNLPVFLWTGAGFAEHVNRVQSSMGDYFGIMIALVIYNLFLYISVRDRDFLLCSFAIASYTLVQGAYYGMLAQFLWPDLIWWTNISLVIFAALIFFAIAVFTNSFLRLKENSKVFHRIMQFFIIYYSAMFIGGFVLSYRLASIMISVMGIVLIFFSGTGYLCQRI